jgi:hypothetical protein
VRIQELLAESVVVDSIRNDMMDLITTYRRKKILTIPMTGPHGAIRYMHNLKHDVNANELMDLLSKPEFEDIVDRSSPKDIKLKSLIPPAGISDDKLDKSEEKIDKAATKSAVNAIKKGETP